ncbi:TIGR03985 family CRISPR-associated protein [Leptolyngbya sp. PCC 6406]|uniref:TIGR03985 family CRISPR-associated protein n=1 Tax=Leptolyngbya sp. PCC 6406 TaxID=1173264 RepID=UPI0002AC2DA5|nr:TIGR03985 family CRISPR-associated protein [Leptolyngbya sp. PCC 6406]
MNKRFDYPPSPAVLQGLSGGQLASRWQRVVRLWWLLRSLYGGETPWGQHLPDPFRYGDLRSRLFAPSHGTADPAAVSVLTAACRDGGCVCQKSIQALIVEQVPDWDQPDWQAEMAQLGLDPGQLDLTAKPFAAVHRSIRDDLKALVAQGWLRSAGRGQFQTVPATQWPPLPGLAPAASGLGFSTTETWELLSALQAIAFVQPNLEVIISRLWEHVTATPEQHRSGWPTEPTRRIFVHLDYILPPEAQERIDSHQEVIERLWHRPDGGVIQFENFLARQGRTATVTVYPVCLHYARRAKYLSAYGLDPDGRVGWHNYRLDRIVSERLRVLPWGDPAIPAALKQLRDCGELPTPADVEAALDQAWGFNFYLPKGWLLMRFTPTFARWYVDDTERHPTFERVSYGEARSRVRQYVPPAEQAAVLAVLARRTPQDVYYAGWVRLGDINVVMRLRDWRPQGEAIAPWGLRQQMAQEAQREMAHYEG